MSEKRQVKIIDAETGDVIREGPERSGGFMVQAEKKFMGLIGFSDVLKLIVMGGALWIFLQKTDLRLVGIENTQSKIVDMQNRFTDFVGNSDGYHSSATGTIFRNGRPINDGYDVGAIRRQVAPTSPVVRD